MPDTTADLLTLTQWLSPAFPVGGFAYSHGLEWAVASGALAGPDVADWVADILRFGAGRTDAILLCHAMRPDTDLAALNDLACALAASAERLSESRDQGTAFAATVSALGPEVPACLLPVAVGAAARRLSLPSRTVAALYLHAFAATIIAAAVRFVPLGQTEGQRITAQLHPLIGTIADDAACAPLDTIAGAAIGGDIASMRHETLETRIFRT